MSPLNPHFLKHIRQAFPEYDDFDQFIHTCQQPPRKSIRVNTLKINIDTFKKIAQQYNWQLQAIPWCPSGFWLQQKNIQENVIALGNTIQHLQGLFYIQESCSMLPAEVLVQLLKQKNIQAKTILDMAAAPGSKTTHLSALTHDKTAILANEISSSRIKSLHANIQRSGITQNFLSQVDGRRFSSFKAEQFDAILLDAPCSGEGTIRKNPHVLDNWHINTLKKMSELQRALLNSASHVLSEKGILVYSTCTLSKEENHDVCNDFLKNNTQMKQIPLNQNIKGLEKSITSEGYLHVFPHHYDCEGFFVAAFQKSTRTSILHSTKDSQKETPSFSSKLTLPKKNLLTVLLNYYKEQFSIDLKIYIPCIYQDKSSFWIQPETFSQFETYVPISRSGIKICEQHAHTFRTDHGFIIALGHLAKKNTISLNAEQAKHYLQGKDIEFASDLKSEVILIRQQHCLGLGKIVGHKIKNNLPRNLVCDNPVA